MNNVALRMDNVSRCYVTGAEELAVLIDVNLEIKHGELVALTAPSGAGKSTLLHVAGLLEHPNSGEVTINGQPCSKLPDRKRTRIRRNDVGFVYQFHHLQPEFSAIENVMLPQMIAGVSKRSANKKAAELLERVGLMGRANHRPGKLSGGEQQRVAIARAIANKPNLLLADEPTGNLDPSTADDVFDMLTSLVREQGLGALIATHNMNLADRMDRVLSLENGRIIQKK